jgi:hypothetical protein
MSTQLQWIGIAALVAALGLLVVRQGEAQGHRVPEAQGESLRWQLSFTPDLWAAGMAGRVGTGGQISEISVGIGDIIDQFDIGLMGLFEARRAPWVIRADLIFLNLGAESGGITADQEELILQPEVGRTVIAQPWGTVDILAGARYWDLTLDLTSPPQQVSGSKNWIDATLGAGWRFQPAQSWHLFAKGDLGGGGSNFSWQGYGGAGYDLGHCCMVSGLYRYLSVDYETDDAFVYDVHFNGPALGLTLRF